jgi:DtxR family Mn-dependent transcriptional regulator
MRGECFFVKTGISQKSGKNLNLSRTQQDYIKSIWNLDQTGAKAGMKVVADTLLVKSPTVLAMFRQLSKMGLISYDKHQGARLTTAGHVEAEQLIRKHRLIETFLRSVLKIEEPLLHNEAEKLEHVISDQLIMKIDEYLKYPSTDPHGSIIPLSSDGDIQYALHEIEPSIPFKVIQIPMIGKEKMYCTDNEFLPGSEWKIKNVGPKSESFLVTNNKVFLAISDHLAEKIKVTIVRA